MDIQNTQKQKHTEACGLFCICSFKINLLLDSGYSPELSWGFQRFSGKYKDSTL